MCEPCPTRKPSANYSPQNDGSDTGEDSITDADSALQVLDSKWEMKLENVKLM